MVLLLVVLTAILLFDLVFNFTCFFPEQCHFIVHLVASFLYNQVVMAAISAAFPNIARLPNSLYVPSSSCQIVINESHTSGLGQLIIKHIDSNLDVLQCVLLLLLCLCLQHFETRQFHHTDQPNLFFSAFICICAALTVIVLINWENMCKTCSKQIVKYNQMLNYLLEIILFPAVGTLKLFLHLLEPLYKACLHIKGRKIKWLPKTKERQNDTTLCTKKKHKKKSKLPKTTTQLPLTLGN